MLYGENVKRKEYLKKIKEILSESNRFVIDTSVDGLNFETKIVDDLSMDSIQIIDLLVEVENQLDIRFDFEILEAENISTLGTIIDMIENCEGKA